MARGYDRGCCNSCKGCTKRISRALCETVLSDETEDAAVVDVDWLIGLAEESQKDAEPQDYFLQQRHPTYDKKEKPRSIFRLRMKTKGGRVIFPEKPFFFFGFHVQTWQSRRRVYNLAEAHLSIIIKKHYFV